MPDLPHDARHVGGAGRAADQGARSRDASRSAGARSQIENELVGNFGQGILAAPPHRGFDLLAWWLPLGGVLAGAALLAVGVWRWSRTREPDVAAEEEALDPETEKRLDEMLARLD